MDIWVSYTPLSTHSVWQGLTAKNEREYAECKKCDQRLGYKQGRSSSLRRHDQCNHNVKFEKTCSSDSNAITSSSDSNAITSSSDSNAITSSSSDSNATSSNIDSNAITSSSSDSNAITSSSSDSNATSSSIDSYANTSSSDFNAITSSSSDFNAITSSSMYVYLLRHNYKKAKQVQSLKNSKITNKARMANKQASKLCIAS